MFHLACCIGVLCQIHVLLIAGILSKPCMLYHPHISACLSPVQLYHRHSLLLLVDLCYQYCKLVTLSDELKKFIIHLQSFKTVIKIIIYQQKIQTLACCSTKWGSYIYTLRPQTNHSWLNEQFPCELVALKFIHQLVFYRSWSSVLYKHTI